MLSQLLNKNGRGAATAVADGSNAQLVWKKMIHQNVGNASTRTAAKLEEKLKVLGKCSKVTTSRLTPKDDL